MVQFYTVSLGDAYMRVCLFALNLMHAAVDAGVAGNQCVTLLCLFLVVVTDTGF